MLNEQEVKAAYCELAPKLTNYLKSEAKRS